MIPWYSMWFSIEVQPPYHPYISCFFTLAQPECRHSAMLQSITGWRPSRAATWWDGWFVDGWGMSLKMVNVDIVGTQKSIKIHRNSYEMHEIVWWILEGKLKSLGGIPYTVYGTSWDSHGDGDIRGIPVIQSVPIGHLGFQGMHHDVHESFTLLLAGDFQEASGVFAAG